MSHFSCCIPGCQANSFTTRLIKFPVSKQHCDVWCRILHSRYPSLNSVFKRDSDGRCQKWVCVNHFEENCFGKCGERKRDAYPTLFTPEEILGRIPTEPISVVWDNGFSTFPQLLEAHEHDHSYTKFKRAKLYIGEEEINEVKLAEIAKKAAETSRPEDMISKGRVYSTPRSLISRRSKYSHHIIGPEAVEPTTETSFTAPMPFAAGSIYSHGLHGPGEVQTTTETCFTAPEPIAEEIIDSHHLCDAESLEQQATISSTALTPVEANFICQNQLHGAEANRSDGCTPMDIASTPASPQAQETVPSFSWEQGVAVVPCDDIEDDTKDDYMFFAPNSPESDPKIKDEPSEPDHEGFQCDNCSSEIVGFRYTCVVCADWDLCGACEARQAHAHHYVLRIPPGRAQGEVSSALRTVRRALLSDAFVHMDAPHTHTHTHTHAPILDEIKEEEEDPINVELQTVTSECDDNDLNVHPSVRDECDNTQSCASDRRDTQSCASERRDTQSCASERRDTQSCASERYETPDADSQADTDMDDIPETEIIYVPELQIPTTEITHSENQSLSKWKLLSDHNITVQLGTNFLTHNIVVQSDARTDAETSSEIETIRIEQSKDASLVTQGSICSDSYLETQRNNEEITEVEAVSQQTSLNLETPFASQQTKSEAEFNTFITQQNPVRINSHLGTRQITNKDIPQISNQGFFKLGTNFSTQPIPIGDSSLEPHQSSHKIDSHIGAKNILILENISIAPGRYCKESGTLLPTQHFFEVTPLKCTSVTQHDSARHTSQLETQEMSMKKVIPMPIISRKNCIKLDELLAIQQPNMPL